MKNKVRNDMFMILKIKNFQVNKSRDKVEIVEIV